MDKIRALVVELATWISRHPVLPLIFVSYYQRTRSYNRPTPYVGFIYQDGVVCRWWELGGVRRPYPANHLVLVSTHRGSSSAEIRGTGGLWVCTFNVAAWERYEDLLQHYFWAPHAVRHPARLCHAYRDAAFQFQIGRHAQGLFLKAAVLQLLGVIFEELNIVDNPPLSVCDGSTEKAVRFLNDNYANPRVALPAIAAAAGLSVHHFGRSFQRVLGVPPMKYLQSLRISQSQKLLTSTDLRIKEIASEVGFEDPLHFSRVFCRVTGLPPRQYRSRQRV